MKRNLLVFEIFEIMKIHDFDYILIENVPRFLEMYFPFNGEAYKLIDLLNIQFSHLYNIETAILNAKDFGTPQSRPRAFIKIFKKAFLGHGQNHNQRLLLRKPLDTYHHWNQENIQILNGITQNN